MPKTMKAVVYKGQGVVALEDRDRPVLKAPTDAIVRVTLSTICTSDLHIKHGAVPRAKENTVLGHEFVGIVEEAGEGVKNFKPGDRVAVNVETFCGTCYFCKRGYVNNCVEGGWELGCRIDGCQAEYVRVPLADQGLTKIPDSVTDERALFLGDILATGYFGAEISEINPADTVAIIGAGPVGLCTMMCVKLFGPAKVIAIDVDDARLALCKKEGLADVCINPKKEDLKAAILSQTEGRGADAVIEAAGGRDTFQTAWQIARPNAVVAIIALYEEAQMLPLHLMYGKNLIFKTGGVDAHCLGEVMKLIECGKINTDCLITHQAPLNDIMEGYRIFENHEDGCIKWVITPYQR